MRGTIASASLWRFHFRNSAKKQLSTLQFISILGAHLLPTNLNCIWSPLIQIKMGNYANQTFPFTFLSSQTEVHVIINYVCFFFSPDFAAAAMTPGTKGLGFFGHGQGWLTYSFSPTTKFSYRYTINQSIGLVFWYWYQKTIPTLKFYVRLLVDFSPWFEWLSGRKWRSR